MRKIQHAGCIFIAAIFAVLVATPAHAQNEGQIRQEIRSTYSFSPHELSSKAISEKSAVLDAFWEKVKMRQNLYLPVLRSELARTDASPFFLYDGSILLLSLSDIAGDRRTALNAISRCDLRDVDPDDYLRQVHRLASLGEDTTDAAFHILMDPEFKVFIPQHALTLGQDYSLIYMLLPTNPDRWLTRAISRLSTEREATAQKSLLLLAWYAQTIEADAAITAFSKAPDKSASNRKIAQDLLAKNSTLASDRRFATATSEAVLRTERRELMKSVSDEALIELDHKTGQIAAKRR